MDLSIVIPEYGCREALGELYRRLTSVCSEITSEYELIFVEDSDPQNSWEDIQKLCAEDQKVKGIHFSRNFGQERAITAGVDYSNGSYVVVMDCDLQDRPEGITELYQKAKEGYDVVFVRRIDRIDSRWTMFWSHLFYRVYNRFSDDNYDPAVGNFSIASRRIVDQFCRMREKNRDYIMFLRWLGFRTTVINVEADERAAGKSSYTFHKKLKLAVETITAQSNKPLWISVYLGMIFAVFSLLAIIYLVIRHFADGSSPEGWASLLIAVFLMGGLMLATTGIAGIYIGNIFNEVKDRPLYVIEDLRNLDGKSHETR